MKAVIIMADYEEVGDVLLVPDGFDVRAHREDFIKGLVTQDPSEASNAHHNFLRANFPKLEFDYAW